MSIFGNIASAIFGSAKANAASPPPSAGASPAATPSTGPSAVPSKSAAADPGPASTAPLSQVDVEAVLKDLAAKKRQNLDWRRSIVDLMKLLDLDSSLAARKQLAKELNYTGNIKNSAAMNVWLHKQVMIKLAASGGKVPDDLRA
jgi:hypothetical protein